MFGGRTPTHPSPAVLTLLSGISEVPNMSIPKSIMLFTAFSSLFISALSISLNSVSFERCFPKPAVERNSYPRKILSFSDRMSDQLFKFILIGRVFEHYLANI